MCERFVTNQLKSPSTADFGDIFDNRSDSVFVDKNDEAILKLDIPKFQSEGVWIVTGNVDSQNPFGAMIRSDYMCIMEYRKKGDSWILLDIIITSS